MAKTNYYLSQFFPEEFQKLIRKKQDFQYIRTSYTKKLKTKSAASIFNPDGTGDDRILSLINKVRNDGKKYLQEHENNLNNGKIYFLDMFTIPEPEEIICKVDITSAYWKQASMQGIISKDTNRYFNDTFGDRTGKELKGIRLKALGSLATRKEIETFEKGKSTGWYIEEQPTKVLYMSICRSIDQLMRQCRIEVEGCIFYYWDCMFVKKKFSEDVINFFKEKQFECKTEETKLSYDKVGTKGIFISEVDGKMYMLEQENKHLLKHVQ